MQRNKKNFNPGRVEKLFERKNILLSLNPLFVYTKISGIPAYSEQRNESCCNQILGYFSRILTFISLFINCFFQVYNCAEGIQTRFNCGRLNDVLINLPLQLTESFQLFIRTFFVAGVPLVFAFQFYVTRRFKQIWSSIEEIEIKLVPPIKFYRKFRKFSLLLIAISSR